MLHRENHKCHVALVLIKIGHETKTVTIRSVRQMRLSENYLIFAPNGGLTLLSSAISGW